MLPRADHLGADVRACPPDDEKLSSWLLGPQRRPLGIDREWVMVRFDDEGRFRDFRLWND